jgi:hypothetical protein
LQASLKNDNGNRHNEVVCKQTFGQHAKPLHAHWHQSEHLPSGFPDETWPYDRTAN